MDKISTQNKFIKTGHQQAKNMHGITIDHNKIQLAKATLAHVN